MKNVITRKNRKKNGAVTKSYVRKIKVEKEREKEEGKAQPLKSEK